DDARHAVETRERDEYRGVAFAFAGSLQPQRDVAGEAQDVAYARAFPRAGAGDAVPHVVVERAQVDLRAALDAGFDHRVAEEFQRIVEHRWQLFHRHDRVDDSAGGEVLARLHPRGERFAGDDFVDLGPEESHEGFGLGNGHVAE